MEGKEKDIDIQWWYSNGNDSAKREQQKCHSRRRKIKTKTVMFFKRAMAVIKQIKTSHKLKEEGREKIKEIQIQTLQWKRWCLEKAKIKITTKTRWVTEFEWKFAVPFPTFKPFHCLAVVEVWIVNKKRREKRKRKEKIQKEREGRKEKDGKRHVSPSIKGKWKGKGENRGEPKKRDAKTRGPWDGK